MAKAVVRWFVLLLASSCVSQIGFTPDAIAQETIIRDNSTSGSDSDKLDIDPQVIDESPVLRKWLQETPNILEDIKHDPAFATRLRIGFTTFPKSDDASGISLSIEDIFIKNTGLTFSADYHSAFNGDRNAIGADLHYFVLPLGNYINFAPLVGYRYVQSNDFVSDGVRVGLRMMLSLSRTGAGDISVSQSFVAPGGDREVGITSFSAGYALTSHLRLSGDIERQNSIDNSDNRYGINLEWTFY